MADDDAGAEIARLEAEIERLAAIAESCRKVILTAKIALAVAVAALLAMLVGVLTFDAFTVLGSVATLLVGVVAIGSNTTTLRQTTAAIRDAEALRAELIDRLQPTLVPDAGPDGRPPWTPLGPNR